jgi:hypothetical protein
VKAAGIRKLRITSVTPYYRRRPGFPLDADSGDALVTRSLDMLKFHILRERNCINSPAYRLAPGQKGEST